MSPDLVIEPPDNPANLADNEKIVEKVRPLLATAFRQYKSQRDPYETVWEALEDMFRCGQNEAIRGTERAKFDSLSANDDVGDVTETRSRVGSTLHYRSVVTLAAQKIRVLNASESPFEYVPRYNPSVFSTYQQADQQADQHNTLMRWTRKRDSFATKMIDAAMQSSKLGNVPVMVYWRKRTATRKMRVPVYSKVFPDKIEDYIVVDMEYPVDCHPTLEILPIENVYADTSIGNLQDQDTVIVRGIVNLSEFLSGKRSGIYKNVDDVKPEHKWRPGQEEDDVSEERRTSSGLDEDEGTVSESCGYVKLTAFARLPITDEGKWDDDAEPRLYQCVFAADFNSGPCLQIERNSDPDDEIPIRMIHDMPDASDMLYHLAPGQVIRSNYHEQTTAKRQAIDVKSLIANPAKKVVAGEVHNKDMRLHKGKTFFVDRPESLTWDQTPDVTQSVLLMLQYLDDDSKRALALESPITGEEGLGSRATAVEVERVHESAESPHLMMVQYFLEQILGFYASKCIGLWHLYSEPNQIVSITDEPERKQIIRPGELFGDFDVDLVVFRDYEINANKARALRTIVEAGGAIPQFAAAVNWRNFATQLCKRYRLDASELVLPQTDDERAKARRENALMERGIPAEPSPGEPHAEHLLEHYGDRQRFYGHEEQHANIGLLDKHIAATEQMRMQEEAMQAAQAQAMAAQAGGGELPGGVTPAEPAEGAMPGGAV
jgi:hypothetical protein